ncbi:nitrogen fixation protein NifQ [Methylocapsa polymorpha]|uniref:Nitrogen fixation protein NifQ n=1 Tax=Methylocapsa polymorpha TaxID=3080828 RepID=A0ABZ0HW05_9HYPH|nr:nitrogen fixation protein NifQ [Methylocapsa sp. RX1]
MRLVGTLEENSGGAASCLEASAAPSEQSFDRHVLGRIFLHSAAEAARLGDTIADRLGVDPDEFAALARYLCVDSFVESAGKRELAPEDEELMVRTLLMQNRSADGSVGQWLASIVARRALESNHLWEDLGLATRGDLSKLLLRHFPGLAEKNTRNMRWKKFLYRALCEAEGFSMCPSPTCDSCAEFHICFGDESGPSALARTARNGGAC